MATAQVTPPPGFVLDAPAPDGLPAGFSLDAPAAPARPAAPLTSLQDYGKAAYGWNDYPKRSALYPIAEDAEGKTHFAMPQVGVDVLNSALLPGYAAKGGRYTAQDTLGLAGLISPMSPALRGAKPATATTPTTAELKKEAGAGYDAAKAMDVTYGSDATKQMANGITADLNKEGLIPELNDGTKGVHALLKMFDDPPADSFVTLDALQALRRRLGDLGQSPDATTRKAATEAIHTVDDYIESGASHASDILKTARGNAAAAFRAKDVAKLEYDVNLDTKSVNSGKNLGNKIRQRLASLLKSESDRRGYSPSEIAAMEQVVEGTTLTNTLRNVSNKLGGGGGLAQMLMAGMGAAVGAHAGPVGAAIGAGLPMATGATARAVGNKLTEKQLTAVQDLIRQRSPLYADRLANPGTVPTSPMGADIARRLALAEALRDPDKSGLKLDPNAY